MSIYEYANAVPRTHLPAALAFAFTASVSLLKHHQIMQQCTTPSSSWTRRVGALTLTIMFDVTWIHLLLKNRTGVCSFLPVAPKNDLNSVCRVFYHPGLSDSGLWMGALGESYRVFGDLQTRGRNLGQQFGLFVSPGRHYDTYKTPSGRVNRVRGMVFIREGPY